MRMNGAVADKDVNLFSLIHIGNLVTALCIIAATWFIVRLVAAAFSRLGDRFAGKRLTLNHLATLVRFGLYLGGLTLAVALTFDLSQEVLLALTGTAAVTLGFAFKDLAASILAGIIIIIDRPFQVGDRVTFAGVYGEIRSIGLRSVRLYTLDESVITIPNNKFLTDIVSSSNWGALDMLVQTDFFVGVDQDIALAKQLVGECLTSCHYVYPKPPWVVRVNQVFQNNYLAVRLRAKACVFDIKYEKAFESDLTERVLRAFRDHGVQPPAVLYRSLPDLPAPSSAPALRAIDAP
jgi:small-conductance mechanosensitive channel